MSTAPDIDYTLIVSKPDDTGRIYIHSPQVPGLNLYGYPREVHPDVPRAVRMLDELNGRRRP